MREYYLQTISTILGVAVYNLIGVFLHTPIVISYWSLLVALAIVSLTFAYLKSQALPIDWKLLARVDKELKEESTKPPEVEVEEQLDVEPESEEVAMSNKEIQMVEVEEDIFDFGDSLASLYKTGTPEQLSDVAVNGIEQKVRRMNLR